MLDRRRPVPGSAKHPGKQTPWRAPPKPPTRNGLARLTRNGCEAIPAPGDWPGWPQCAHRPTGRRARCLGRKLKSDGRKRAGNCEGVAQMRWTGGPQPEGGIRCGPKGTQSQMKFDGDAIADLQFGTANHRLSIQSGKRDATHHHKQHPASGSCHSHPASSTGLPYTTLQRLLVYVSQIDHQSGTKVHPICCSSSLPTAVPALTLRDCRLFAFLNGALGRSILNGATSTWHRLQGSGCLFKPQC